MLSEVMGHLKEALKIQKNLLLLYALWFSYLMLRVSV